jgi:hypothetical protein
VNENSKEKRVSSLTNEWENDIERAFQNAQSKLMKGPEVEYCGLWYVANFLTRDLHQKLYFLFRFGIWKWGRQDVSIRRGAGVLTLMYLLNDLICSVPVMKG